jgi:hypothetical protein
MTVYEVLDRIDNAISDCDRTIRRSHRRKALFNLVRATARKKTLAELKTYILANH